MNIEDYTRQLLFANPAKLNTPIQVIGAGGIGSHVVLALARMGCQDLVVYDDDTVEEHNRSNQMFLYDTLGQAKVYALQNTIRQLTDIEVDCLAHKASRTSLFEGIVISGLDSMAARSEVWLGIKDNPNVTYYVDGRMGGQVGQLLHLNPRDSEQARWYEERLVDDGDVRELPCTGRSICYTLLAMGAVIGSLVRQLCMGETVTIARETTFDLQNGVIAPAEKAALAYL